MNVKRLILTLLTCLTLQLANAQTDRPKFDPAKFRQDLIAFVVGEATLTPAEKVLVMPIYEEYLTKKQELFKKMGTYRNFSATNDKAYADAIESMDGISIEMKTLQQTCHRRLLKVLSAKKVYTMIRAEKEFNKRCFQRITHKK